MKKIKGPFQVKAIPLEADDIIKRMGGMKTKFEKTFTGPLEATSVVSMMGILNKEIGSGAYVALEQLEGLLEGKRGSFCLAHASFMNRGKPEQSITVVPDSGRGELASISGRMNVEIANGDHSYVFEYSLD